MAMGLETESREECGSSCTGRETQCEQPICDFWWSHRTLRDELREALSNPQVESLMRSCTEELKLAARVVLEAVSTHGFDQDVKAWESAMTPAWHKRVVDVRDQLLAAFVQDQGEAGKRTVEPESPGQLPAVSATEAVGSSALRQKVLHIVLKVMVSEWGTYFGPEGEGAKVPRDFSELVDHFLEGIAFANLDTWVCTSSSNGTGAEQQHLLESIATYLHDDLKMSLVEQARLLPRFVQKMWELFRAELLELEESVPQLCSVHSASDGEGNTFDGVGNSRVRFLVSDVSEVLRKLNTGAPEGDSLKDPNSNHRSGYIVVPNSLMAGFMVQSIGKWLPVCGEFLYSMLVASNACVREGANDVPCEAGGNPPSREKDASDSKECPKTEGTLSAAEVRLLLRGLRHEMQRIFVFLEGLEEFTPCFVVLASIMAHTFHTTRERSQPSAGQCKLQGVMLREKNRELTSLRAFLVWHGRVVAPSSPSFLIDVCYKALNSIVSCALDKTFVPTDVHTRALRILLVYRPVATLHHLFKSLCTAGTDVDKCDFEVIVTDRSMASASRSTAFSEVSLKGNDVAYMFFPKFFAVFSCVERSLAGLCDDMELLMNAGGNSDEVRSRESATNASQLVEQFFAAALEESVVATSAGNLRVAASELLMFLCFVASDSPLFEESTVKHVRNAARHLFAPGLPMMSCLHRLIRQRQLHGLVAFFLPPLRAIGVDCSSAKDSGHVACALRYPRCAEVAYLEELPRGYYCRQPQRLALNAKNDALQFFHNILMLPGSMTRERDHDKAVQREDDENESEVVRRLFIEIVSHVGEAVMVRLLGGGEGCLPGSGITGCVVVDAMMAFFTGVIRLCNTVTYWELSRRQEVRQAIVEQLLASQTVRQREPVLTRLALSVLFRGSVSEFEGDESPIPYAWCDYLCEMELEDVDTRANVCAMTLLRQCNLSYMKSIPTKTLLACRATLEQTASKGKGPDIQEKVDVGVTESVRKDFESLRRMVKKITDAEGRSEIPHKSGGTADAVENEEACSATPDALGEQVKAEESSERLLAPSVETKIPVAQTENESGKELGPVSPDEQQQLSGAVKRYMDAMVSLFIMRARSSVVDGVLTSIAVRKWLGSCVGCFESQVLFSTLRRMVLRVNGTLAHATKMECSAFAAFLEGLVDGIILPYAVSSSAAANSSSNGHGQHSRVGEAVTTSDNEERSGRFHCTPLISSKEATQLLQILIVDITRCIVRFLGENTTLGDWKAFTLTRHLRRILGLVERNKGVLQEALKRRQDVLGLVLSTDKSHPVHLLAAVECPLLEKMTKPAVSVTQLFADPPTTVVGVRTEPQSGSASESRPGDKSKRRRERDHEVEASVDQYDDGDESRNRARYRRDSGNRDFYPDRERDGRWDRGRGSRGQRDGERNWDDGFGKPHWRYNRQGGWGKRGKEN